ncbi:hypothetical protein [Sodalis sp. dw_96]|uniref:hypothetical protein n=1 Tax=Sodalis sp. dw_96 TaxID=2719794 RepID=UPI001BD2EB9E|nr:hypothetical protein [Sodalis sp. dw_96]
MDINNCSTSNNAPGQASAIISLNGHLPKRFAALISNLESVSNHTDKASIKEFINFSKENHEKINSSLMSVSNPQEVVELIQEASRLCLIIKDEINVGDGNMPYILQEEGKLEGALESLKDRLQRDISIQTNEKAPLSIEEKLKKEAKRIGEQIQQEIPRAIVSGENEVERSSGKIVKELSRLGKRFR